MANNVIICPFISFLISLSTSLLTSDSSNPASPCCVPVHFQTMMDVTGGYTLPNSKSLVFVDRKVHLYYDYAANATRTDTNVTLPDGTTFTHTEITFYSQHVSYFIDGNKCRMKHITDRMQDRCIPDYATLHTAAYIGSVGIRAWQYLDPSTNVTTIRAVTSNDCIPIVQAEYGIINGGFSLMTYMLGDVKRLERPADMTIPDICLEP